jgi:hypothetical protein
MFKSLFPQEKKKQKHCAVTVEQLFPRQAATRRDQNDQQRIT